MRPDLLALTPESVAALANLGLVKRAQREIAAGQGPTLEEDEAGVVIGRFEGGIETRLPRGVPLRDAPCSCGASTVCRHRVAVVLAYAAWQAAHAPATVRPFTPEAFTDDALVALAGKRIVKRASDIRRAGIAIELEAGATPVARLPTCSVRFHVPDDLAYARCDCKVASACEHVVLAAWAFRRASERGLALPATIELGEATSKAAATSDDALDAAAALAAHVLRTGISRLGEGEAARFAHARAALAPAKDLLWPQTIVEDLEIAAEAYRARSARYRTADVVHLLASLAARTRAARAAGLLPRRTLLGSDEARETALDHVRLVSLGARVVADGRARDAEVYLADPDSGTVLVASKRWTYPDDAEPDDGPALARRTIASRVSLGALARGQLVTRAAKRHANHAITLSTTRSVQTSIAPSTGDWGSLPPSLLVRDFTALRGALLARPPALLRPRILAGDVRVLALAPGSVLRLGYRSGEQELVAVLGDGAGGAVHLVRRHTRAAPNALDAIARALDGMPAPRYVAGQVRVGRWGVEIEPTAIATDRVVVPDLDEERTKLSLPELASLAPEPIAAALARARALVEESLHDGLEHLRPGFLPRLQASAAALADVGLAGAEQRIATLADAIARGDGVAAWLDAAIRLDLTAEALAGEAV